MKETFGRLNRLKTADQFRKAYKNGTRFKQYPFVVWICPNQKSMSRIGITISSKTCKSSCRRNRMKRLVRETYRRNKTIFPAGFDFLVKINKADKHFSYLDIERGLLSIIKKGKTHK